MENYVFYLQRDLSENKLCLYYFLNINIFESETLI